MDFKIDIFQEYFLSLSFCNTAKKVFVRIRAKTFLAVLQKLKLKKYS
jgi:hypothetical protein